RVAVERPVRRQPRRLADLHGRDVRARHRDLHRRARRPQAPGHRPRPDQQRDPGRVARSVRCGRGGPGARRRAPGPSLLRGFEEPVSMSDLAGRTFLVTGANTGIGLATAAGLARRGGRVYVASRSPEKGAAAVASIRAATGNEAVSFLPLDLADLDSVRACAASFLARGEPLHVLVNNAGVAGRRGLTRQGFELTFGVNHLGHFVLTNALLGCLEASAPARVVTVSSDAHYSARGI